MHRALTLLNSLARALFPRPMPITPRPPMVGFETAPAMVWAAWGHAPFRVWTVHTGGTRWFVSQTPQGFAIERRDGSTYEALTPARSLRGAIARVEFDVWGRSQCITGERRLAMGAEAQALGIPYGFLDKGPA